MRYHMDNGIMSAMDYLHRIEVVLSDEKDLP